MHDITVEQVGESGRRRPVRLPMGKHHAGVEHLFGNRVSLNFISQEFLMLSSSKAKSFFIACSRRSRWR